VVAGATGTPPSTTVLGLGERDKAVVARTGIGTGIGTGTREQAVVARSGIGTGLLPFTGVNARALLLTSVALLGVGGCLLVWASRGRRVRTTR
jgi:hypothetical protein